MSKPIQLILGAFFLLTAASLGFAGVAGLYPSLDLAILVPLLAALPGVLFLWSGLSNPVPPEHRIWFQREWALINVVKGLAITTVAGAATYAMNYLPGLRRGAPFILLAVPWGLYVTFSVQRTVCSRCGSGLESGHLDGQSVEYCATCNDLIFWPRRRPAEVVQGVEATQLLAQVRSRVPWELEKS